MIYIYSLRVTEGVVHKQQQIDELLQDSRQYKMIVITNHISKCISKLQTA